MTATATKTHRVFDVINGLYPVTFHNVREADPAALLDIFEENTDTRDLYFEQVIKSNNTADWLKHSKGQEGNIWATTLSGFDTEHTDECYFSDGSQGCRCKEQQWTENQQWGRDLFKDIQQRIGELNG